jgi:hypothetical protein
LNTVAWIDTERQVLYFFKKRFKNIWIIDKRYIFLLPLNLREDTGTGEVGCFGDR